MKPKIFNHKGKLVEPIKVETIKNWGRTPADLEYQRQKTKVADDWCRHLTTRTEIVRNAIVDDAHDECYDVETEVCVKCNKVVKYL